MAIVDDKIDKPANSTIDGKPDDKVIVKDYFNATGFDRWRRIYGDGEVNKVQLDIRKGHQQTVDTLLGWLKDDGNVSGMTFCDAGCGVGSLSIPLAEMGATVHASDISEKMVGEAAERANAILGQPHNPVFETSDLETLSGRYHTVVCLDVLIHYPQEKAAEMIGHLSSLASDRLILSFEQIDLSSFCQVLMEEAERSFGKQHQFIFEQRGAPTPGYFDRKLLRQIVTNLLSNAVKYSEAGSQVKLILGFGTRVCKIQVADMGIGIPQEEQSRLFDFFYRASNVEDIAGTGLGLAIVKKSVEFLRGSIAVESQPQKGTLFTVTLPLEQSVSDLRD